MRGVECDVESIFERFSLFLSPNHVQAKEVSTLTIAEFNDRIRRYLIDLLSSRTFGISVLSILILPNDYNSITV